jgi:HAD superfamily 5'-nucleotidase-like hydrolase
MPAAADLHARLLDLLKGSQTLPSLDPTRQVFCNRNLDMRAIEWVGFDMDYTLALYHQAPLDRLTLHLTLQRLVRDLDYPPSILNIQPRPHFAIRGLVIDKHNANIFKMDSHRHVGKAFHGFQPLPDAEHDAYRRMSIRITDRYHLVDTLFALPEAFLLSALCDLFERDHGALPMPPERLFSDIRDSIDLIHRDDSLKSEILSDLPRYIIRDPDLASTLHRMRSSGKKLFLMTNSLWPYTDAVMRFLLNDTLPEYPNWQQFFDVIITGAQKPAFFKSQNPLLRIDKAPIYQGGNIADFERLIQASGPSILYVGDHIYGDILKSRTSSSWRTCMIIQEMDDELRQLALLRDQLSQHNDLSQELSRLDSELFFLSTLQREADTLLDQLASLPDPLPDGLDPKEAPRLLRQQARRLQRRRHQTISLLHDLNAEVERHFNPYWGLIFKEGSELSIFGKQVDDFACLYTSRVSNLRSYSPLHHFHAPVGFMSHEL